MKIHKEIDGAIFFDARTTAFARAGDGAALRGALNSFQGVDESAGISESLQSLAAGKPPDFF
jgi:hypothetical protein